MASLQLWLRTLKKFFPMKRNCQSQQPMSISLEGKNKLRPKKKNLSKTQNLLNFANLNKNARRQIKNLNARLHFLSFLTDWTHFACQISLILLPSYLPWGMIWMTIRQPPPQCIDLILSFLTVERLSFGIDISTLRNVLFKYNFLLFKNMNVSLLTVQDFSFMIFLSFFKAKLFGLRIFH